MHEECNLYHNVCVLPILACYLLSTIFLLIIAYELYKTEDN